MVGFHPTVVIGSIVIMFVAVGLGVWWAGTPPDDDEGGSVTSSDPSETDPLLPLPEIEEDIDFVIVDIKALKGD